MPMIEVTEEELERRQRREVMGRARAARARGAENEAREIERDFAPSAEVLLSAKRVMGREWLRQQTFDMRHAEEAYGTDWLDR